MDANRVHALVVTDGAATPIGIISPATFPVAW